MRKQRWWLAKGVMASLAWAGLTALTSCNVQHSSTPSPTVSNPITSPGNPSPSPSPGASPVGSSPSGPSPNRAGQPFPNQLVQDFIGGCTSAGVSAAACRCTITQIQQTYSYEQFNEINQAMGRGIPAPEGFSKIVATCKQAQ
jgi:hypothetical protein